MQTVPSSTIELLNILKEKYPDKYVIEDEEVGTPSYWKKAGVVELLRELEYYITERSK